MHLYSLCHHLHHVCKVISDLSCAKQGKAKQGWQRKKQPALRPTAHTPTSQQHLPRDHVIMLPAQLPLPPDPAPFTPQVLLLSDVSRSPVISILPHLNTTSRAAGKCVTGGATPPPSGNADSVTPTAFPPISLAHLSPSSLLHPLPPPLRDSPDSLVGRHALSWG